MSLARTDDRPRMQTGGGAQARRHGPKVGPVGQRVAERVKIYRGTTPVRELSARLEDLGRPILPSGITKIEQGTRRVDVDDLMALAQVLDVTPSQLLFDSVAPSDGRRVMGEKARLRAERDQALDDLADCERDLAAARAEIARLNAALARDDDRSLGGLVVDWFADVDQRIRQAVGL